MVAHGIIGARAIPIGGVENLRRHCVLHLQQPAGVLVPGRITAYKGAGDPPRGWKFFARLYKGTLEILLPEVDDFRQRG